MTKKRLELIGNILAVMLFIWIAISVLEIGMRNPLVENYEYSAWNFVILLFNLFGGV